MKIISWNIYKENKDFAKAIAFLKKQQADIICLQEFPAEHIDLLNDLGGHIAACDEVLIYKNKKKADASLYSVIVSKFPIKEQTIIPHKSRYGHAATTKDRYQYFEADSFYVDIDTGEGLFRIFNTHFKCIAGPSHRLSQFKEVVTHLSPDRHNIICGDFNTFGKPLVNVLLWKYFGYKIHELKINESKHFSALAKEHGLKNPLHRQVTFLKFPVQLDYILIPAHVKVKSKRAFLRPHGSDHFPLLLEI